MEYYIYIYLDPRKEGEYIYGDYCFNHEPFYVGRGKDDRMYEHLSEAKRSKKNTYKLNKIRTIFDLNLEPLIIKLHENLSLEDSIYKEILLIKLIGRHDKKEGVLTNMTDGGEGSLGIIQSEETKNKRVDSLKKSTLLNTVKSIEFKNKISEIVKEKFKNPEIIKKISDSKKGEKNPMYGKTTSEKQKESVRKAHKEGKVKLTEKGRKILSENGKKRKGVKNYNIRSDVKNYKLTSPNNEVFIVLGNYKLQDFCKIQKLQVHTLKNNMDVVIDDNIIKSNNLHAKNTIGWLCEVIKNINE